MKTKNKFGFSYLGNGGGGWGGWVAGWLGGWADGSVGGWVGGSWWVGVGVSVGFFRFSKFSGILKPCKLSQVSSMALMHLLRFVEVSCVLFSSFVMWFKSFRMLFKYLVKGIPPSHSPTRHPTLVALCVLQPTTPLTWLYQCTCRFLVYFWNFVPLLRFWSKVFLSYYWFRKGF